MTLKKLPIRSVGGQSKSLTDTTQPAARFLNTFAINISRVDTWACHWTLVL